MVDGFKENDWLKNMFTVWPIESLMDENNDGEDNDLHTIDFLEHNI